MAPRYFPRWLVATLCSLLFARFALGAAQPAPVTRAVERGRSEFQASCAFCHGSQATGTEQAPSLVRSPLVRQDVNGKLLTPMIKAGRPSFGMPSFASLSADQLSDIVAFLHYRATEARSHGQIVPESALLVGDAQAGKAYFDGKGRCNTCHSAEGNLAHIGTRYSPLNLTVAFLTPPEKPKRVNIVLPSGDTVDGVLDYLDEFTVSIVSPAGDRRTFSCSLVKSLKVLDPLAAHRDLLSEYSDSDIHNLLAYLVTLK